MRTTIILILLLSLVSCASGPQTREVSSLNNASSQELFLNELRFDKR